MITCLHTAQVHVATFSGLIPGARHVVRADLLDRARADGVAAVQDEVLALLAELSADGPVLCTCSTLGPLADQAGVLRIDRPAMEAAAACEGEIVVAICLESTRAATLALFEEIAGPGRARLVLCDAAWPFFEAGDMDGFARAIADTVRPALTGAGAVLLA